MGLHRLRLRGLRDWNVIVTVRGDFVMACRLLEPFGRVRRTGYYNVLVMSVADGRALLDELERRRVDDPRVAEALARVMPVTRRFRFSTVEEFERKAAEVVRAWGSELAGKRFHVRLHRRGLKGRLSTQIEERALDRVALDALVAAGTPGSISFDDPDVVIDVETLEKQAGLSHWTRDDLARYPLLHMA